jgi:hypothetical protein
MLLRDDTSSLRDVSDTAQLAEIGLMIAYIVQET